MNLLQICDQNPPIVKPDSTVAEAIREMLEHHIGAIAVVDDNRVVAGIFTERDVLRRLSLSGRDPNSTPVREVMTVPVELATELTSEAEALAVMLERHYRHLPIVDHDGKLLGMLSVRHVLQERVDELVQQLDAIRAHKLA
jgi:CBS domain-containing protein